MNQLSLLPSHWTTAHLLRWKSLTNHTTTTTKPGATKTPVPPRVEVRPHCLSGPLLLSVGLQQLAPHCLGFARLHRLGVRRDLVGRLSAVADRLR
ncbi:unnamed protein product [Ectocarpus sp. CCAP 1310/34]|nr:unnamed protein product [Ectocarpus sp. CCAP 1310/34]